MSHPAATRATWSRAHRSVRPPVAGHARAVMRGMRRRFAGWRRGPGMLPASVGVIVTALATPHLLRHWLPFGLLPDLVAACLLLLAVPTIIARTAERHTSSTPTRAPCDDDCPRHSVSVAAVVVKRGRVLAVQRQSCGRWELPGGVLDRAETIEAGLVREVREETGVTVEPIAHTGVYKHVGRGIVSLVFLCRAVGGNAHHGTPETRALRWMTLREVMSEMRDTFPVRVLDAIVEGRGGPTGHRVVRNHDGVELRPLRR